MTLKLTSTSAALLGALFCSGCATGPGPGTGPAAGDTAESPACQRFEFHQPHMGVPFRIVLYGTDEDRARNAAAAAFARVGELNSILSDYDPDSELSRLSDTAGQGIRVAVTDDLWTVLNRAHQLSVATGGAFDVTIGATVNLWRRARRERKLPDPSRLEKAREASGYQHMRLYPRQRAVELLQPRMRLDLGGIGKGYAVDEALKVLRAHGFPRALVSGGGDIGVGEAPPGRKGWRIEIAPIEGIEAPPARLAVLTNAALATSGDLFQRLEIDGKTYSHILDPRTGIGLTSSALVTVIARDCTTADSLATALSVLPPGEGLPLVESTPGAAAHIVRQTPGGFERLESNRLRQFLEPESGSSEE